MRAFLRLLVIVLGFGSAVFAQEQARPEPEYSNAFYSYDAASPKLLNLERQRATAKGKAKALGYGGIKMTLDIPGAASPVRFPAGQKLSFVFKASASIDPQTLVEVIRLTVSKDHREIPVLQSRGFLGLGGTRSDVSKDALAFETSKYSEGSAQVSITSPLAPGEYIIRAPSSQTVYCFGVDAARK